MAKWIKDWTDASGPHSILCDEVHTSHGQMHNALSGNPQFTVRLEIAWNDLSIALSRLLGQPSKWPHATLLKNVVAVDARVINDAAAYGTDADKQVINYENHALVDVTYIPRNGVYWKLTTDDPTGPILPINQPVYIDDTEESRFETLPQNPLTFIWGALTDVVPSDALKRPMHANEVPVRFNTGQTLIHTIEGWCGTSTVGGFGVENFVGTVHDQDYLSPVTKKFYPAKTLMLRSYNAPKAYTFRSYRQANDPAPTASFFDFEGRSTHILRMVYEFKKDGWLKFWRNNSTTNSSGYYFIRYSESPYNKYIPFPELNHNIFFTGQEIVL